MKYGIGVDNLTVFMTEVDITSFFEENSGYDEIYYTFSDAMDSFKAKSDQFGCWFYFVSRTQSSAITIIASPDRGSFADNDDIEGPYRDPLVAYGIGRLERMNNKDYILDSGAQFNVAAHVIFDCYLDCDERRICKVHLPNDQCINVTPLTPVTVKPGQTVMLRLLGSTEDIYVFGTPDALRAELHMPPKAVIPIGTYSSHVCDQDSSVVITGYVQNVALLSRKDKLQYSLIVKTNKMDVELNVITHYEIKDGDFICAEIYDLSAVFD